MEQFYALTMQGQHLGKVTMERQGLYWCISCRCRLEKRELCRLVIRCGHREIPLGILVPQDDAFVLRTRIPVKQIGEGEISFLLIPVHTHKECVFVPIIPEEPFSYLARLKDSFLVIRNGQPGIETAKMQE